MNILFLSLSRFDDINAAGIYSDLMRELVRRGHEVYIASPTERRFGKPTRLVSSGKCHILKIKTLNIQKTNVIEKGIGTLLLGTQFNRAIRKYWGGVKFDLVLYATPPITFNKVIERVKKRDGARSYLMLKDIFPQNAVDLGMMKEGSLLHRMFRLKESRLYAISDRIGCMSPANCRYVVDHNPKVDPAKVELCPNSTDELPLKPFTLDERAEILSTNGLPADKTIFIYGGNLGKPQGIDFLLRAMEANEGRTDSHFVVIGSGTERPRIAEWFRRHNPSNATLLEALPPEEYNRLAKACDVGLIFLDPRFTIPNFPSRLLSYQQNAMPVLLATDPNTDMGRIAEAEGFGLWCLNGDLDKFMANVDRLAADPELRKRMGQAARRHFLANYTTPSTADILEKFIK